MEQKYKMEKIISRYLHTYTFTHFDFKAVLFDMDGVLYNSMPAHAKSWQETMEECGYTSTEPLEFYYHEGRVGASTIHIITEREFGRKASQKEIKNIYARKSELFAQYNHGEIISGIKEVIQFVKSQGLKPVLVTGSGQPSLLDRRQPFRIAGVGGPTDRIVECDELLARGNVVGRIHEGHSPNLPHLRARIRTLSDCHVACCGALSFRGGSHVRSQ